MELLNMREQLIQTAVCFYQERISDGLAMIEDVLAMVLQVPEFAGLVEPVMETLNRKDYVLLADIFYHEMAMRIEQ